MTLLKKLLPVASIAAAAAVVAPIVTSCAAGGSMTFDPTVEPDVTGWKKSIKSEQTTSAATIEYEAAIKDDINTFKNDYRFGISFIAKFLEISETISIPAPVTSYEFIWDVAKCTLSNVSVGENAGMAAITFKSDIYLETTFIQVSPTSERADMTWKSVAHLTTDALSVPFTITENFDYDISEMALFSLYFGDYFDMDNVFEKLNEEWHVNASIDVIQKQYSNRSGSLMDEISLSSKWEVNKDNIIDINMDDTGNADLPDYIPLLYSWPTYFFLGTTVYDGE